MPKHRFTIYDSLDAKEYFSSNPANAGAKSVVDQSDISVWPVAYPKMLYHPDGEQRVIVPAEQVLRAGQYVDVGEQKELIHRIVQNEAEDKEAQAEGWHDHPAKAIRARVHALIAASNFTEKEEKALLAKIPQLAPSANRIAQLEAEIARLEAERAAPAPGPTNPVPRDALVSELADDDEAAT